MTLQDLFKSFDQNIQVDVAILDFSKAFDTVPYDKLLHKIDSYGIQGNTLKWLSSFLKDRTMKVVVEGEQSKSVTVESGVPQGTVLGPLMYLCHINDLPDVVRSQVRLFADDCLLYRQIKSNEDHVLLQKRSHRTGNLGFSMGHAIQRKEMLRHEHKEHIISSLSTGQYYSITGFHQPLSWYHIIKRSSVEYPYTKHS